MDKELKRAFTELTRDADPDRVQDAVRERIGREGKTAGRTVQIRPMRLLTAALLALTLTVGVYAGISGIVNVVLPEGAGNGALLTFAGEGTALRLSKEKKAALEDIIRTPEEIENGTARDILFASWQEAEDWLGCELLLCDLPAKGVHLQPAGDDLRTLFAWSDFTLPESKVSGTVNVNITTEHWGEYRITTTYGDIRLDENGQFIPSEEGKKNHVTTEQYTNAHGISMVILYDPYYRKTDGILTEYTHIELRFPHENLLYQVVIPCAEAANASADAKKIADSFH